MKKYGVVVLMLVMMACGESEQRTIAADLCDYLSVCGALQTTEQVCADRLEGQFDRLSPAQQRSCTALARNCLEQNVCSLFVPCFVFDLDRCAAL